MKKTLLTLAVTGIIAFTACSQKSEKKHSAGAFKEYIELKEALVASDAEKAKTQADELQNELSKVQGADVQSVKDHAVHLASVSDIEEQRKAFAALSENFISLAKSGALGKNEYYVFHCPMALESKGADWVSDEEEVKNPYFGEQMMTCGEIKERYTEK